MIPLLAIIIGLVLGLLFTIGIPPILYMYFALFVLATLCCLLDGIYAKEMRRFSNFEFTLSWFSTIIISLAMHALGDAIGLELSTAVVVILGIKIFINLTNLRRVWFNKMRKRKRTIKVWMERTGQKASDLPIEEIDDQLSENQVKVNALRERAKMLRLEADSLLNEADVLFEQEAMRQLVRMKNEAENNSDDSGNVTKPSQKESEK